MVTATLHLQGSGSGLLHTYIIGSTHIPFERRIVFGPRNLHLVDPRKRAVFRVMRLSSSLATITEAFPSNLSLATEFN